MSKQPAKIERRFEGVVSATKMLGVATIVVPAYKWSAKYKTQYQLTRKFPAAVRGMNLAVGDRVVIQETRPLSRRVRWAVVKKI